MTPNQFVDKYLGKKIDWDNAYSGQCVDLFRQYVNDVLKLSQPSGVQGAADFWTNYDRDLILKNNFTKIVNTPDAVPQNGDVILWNRRAGGGFGHVAVFISGDVTSFISFDQNWPTLSVCTKTTHNYTNVYGWLRPLVLSKPESMPDDLQKILSHYKVKTADEFIASNDKELQFLANERSKNDGLEQTVRDSKKSHNEFVQKILGILNPFGNPLGLSDEELTIRSVTEVVSSTSQLEAKLADQEKESLATEARLKMENDVLKSQLAKLQDQLDDLKVKHAKDLETMQKRIDKIQSNVETHNDKQDQFETLKSLLKPLLDIAKDWYGKTKQKVQSKQK